MGNDKNAATFRAATRVRISPTIAADYQARHAFPELRPPDGEPPGRYHITHTVTRELAQAIFDDAIEQAARCADHTRRSLTLAYRSLARRTSLNFGEEWHWTRGDILHIDPASFAKQAPIVTAFLRRVRAQ